MSLTFSHLRQETPQTLMLLIVAILLGRCLLQLPQT